VILELTAQISFRSGLPTQFKDLVQWANLPIVSATISRFVTDAKQAKRFFVSGMVQGVGFRYFAQDGADRLRLAGYVRNLRDGRVEVYAIGTPGQLTQFRATLERGPRSASVHNVAEESAAIDAQYSNEFTIAYDA
jgi:acylphosphatase